MADEVEIDALFSLMVCARPIKEDQKVPSIHYRGTLDYVRSRLYRQVDRTLEALMEDKQCSHIKECHKGKVV